MTITVEELDYCSLVNMPPAVDKYLATELLDTFDRLLEHTNNKIVIDFSQTHDIDSSGIGAIVYLFKRLHRRGLSLELIGLQEQPLRKVNGLHLDRIIKISHKIAKS